MIYKQGDQENDQRCPVLLQAPTAILSSGKGMRPRVYEGSLLTGLLNLLIDGITVPFVEELYYRGYLLPRLSRLGWLAPVINALLFTLGHFWQPYNYPLIFLLVLPEICLVYWKRNIKISILLHCAGNTIGALLSLALLFMAR